jgi:hypothetical protein
MWNAVFLIFSIHATFQFIIITQLMDFNLICGTSNVGNSFQVNN